MTCNNHNMNCSLLVEFSPTTCERARYRVIQITAIAMKHNNRSTMLLI